jgi:hypothetical protein
MQRNEGNPTDMSIHCTFTFFRLGKLIDYRVNFRYIGLLHRMDSMVFLTIVGSLDVLFVSHHDK